MKYILTLCNNRVELDTPVEINIDEQSARFLRPAAAGEQPCEYKAVYRIGTEPADVSGGVLRAEEYKFLPVPEGIRCARISIANNKPYVSTEWNYRQKRAEICLLPEYRECLSSPYHVRNYLRMDVLTYVMGGVLLHSSLIDCGGSAIAFTAPSGTGKSTQADLWAKYTGSRIINGDNSVIARIGGVWHGCGFPYSGSSEYALNETAPLKAIVCLKQGTENKLRRLTLREIMRFMYPQLLIQQSDERIVNHSLDLLAELAGEIPIYELSCLPDRGAVELLYNTIFNNKE